MDEEGLETALLKVPGFKLRLVKLGRQWYVNPLDYYNQKLGLSSKNIHLFFPQSARGSEGSGSPGTKKT